MLTIRHLVAAFLLLIPQAVAAQTYEEIRAAYPGARQTTVAAEYAYLYSQPDLSSDIVGRYGQGRQVLAYNKLGDFYALAVPGHGHVGYALLTTLDVPQDPGAAVQPGLTEYKDPRTARLMSLAFPGAGHLYVGQTTTGGLLIGVSMVSFVGGYALTEETRELQCTDVADCRDEVDYTWLVAGASVALAAWAFGIYDAPRAARRANAAEGLSAGVLLVPDAAAAARPGLALRFRW